MKFLLSNALNFDILVDVDWMNNETLDISIDFRIGLKSIRKGTNVF